VGEEIGDQSEVIEDVCTYKARQKLTQGAIPGKLLAEFEESSAR